MLGFQWNSYWNECNCKWMIWGDPPNLEISKVSMFGLGCTGSIRSCAVAAKRAGLSLVEQMWFQACHRCFGKQKRSKWSKGQNHHPSQRTLYHELCFLVDMVLYTFWNVKRRSWFQFCQKAMNINLPCLGIHGSKLLRTFRSQNNPIPLILNTP